MTWQLNTGAAAMRTATGQGSAFPRPTAPRSRRNSLPIVWGNNEPYTIALLIKGRSGGASTKHLYRSGSSSTADHILWLASGITPNLRHQSTRGPSRSRPVVAIMNDTAWPTLVATWRPDGWSCTWTASRVPRVPRRRPTPAPRSASTAGAGASRPRRTSTATSRSSRASPHPGPPPWCGAGTPIRSASCAPGARCLRSWEVRHPHAPLDRHRRGHLRHGVASRPGGQCHRRCEQPTVAASGHGTAVHGHHRRMACASHQKRSAG